MAGAVTRGARTVPGSEIRLLEIDKAKSDDLLWAEAIVPGSPVYLANASVPVLEALAGWPFTALRDKIGAAFVTGGWISGGQELTQVHLLSTLLEFGMIVVGGEGTAPFGASAITQALPFNSMKEEAGVEPKLLKDAEVLGKRVAERASRLRLHPLISHAPKDFGNLLL